jgi:hypothetical protein
MLKLKKIERWNLKLTFFKIWVHFFKSDESSGVVSEVLPNSNLTFIQ